MAATIAAAAAAIAPVVLGRLSDEHLGRLELPWAGPKYHHPELDAWLKAERARDRIGVVSRPPGSEGFVEPPRRWVVERTFARLGRSRRHSRHYERFSESSEAVIEVSSIHWMLRIWKPDQSKEPVPFRYRKLQEKGIG